MKVYVLFEVFDTGIWDDYTEDIIGIYKNIEKAKEIKQNFMETERNDIYTKYIIEEYELIE